MARIFIDGFESGQNDLWIPAGSLARVTASSYGLTGAYAWSHNSGGSQTKTLSSTPLGALYGAFRCNLYATGNISFFKLYLGTTVLATIYYDATLDSIRIYRGDTATLLASGSDNAVPYQTPNLIEYKYVPDSSSGIFQVKVNGILDIDYSGNTVPGSETTLDKVSTVGAYYGGQYHVFDDLIFDDANWVGDTRIYGLSPDGAGATTQWTASAGSNYQCVDEVPASDGDYVSVNSNDQIDTYSLANLGVSPYSIKSVQATARAQKEGASTPQNIALVLRQGGTDYPGSDQALLTSFRMFAELWENDPNTSSPWTESGVNSLEAGVKSRA